MSEEELLRLSFAQIYRVMKALRITDTEQWRKVRRIAYEVWRKDAKNPAPESHYMPIGVEEGKDKTQEELDEIWRKHGKLRRN